MSKQISTYGKQPKFDHWAMISDRNGFRFQDWDELEEYDKLVFIKKYIYEITDPYDNRSSEERDRKSPCFKKDYREVKLSRWKKSLMKGDLKTISQIEYYFEHEKLKFQLDYSQKQRIQQNTEIMCLRRTNEELKKQNKKYETIDDDYDNLQWENMDLKNKIEDLEKKVEVLKDSRTNAVEYNKVLKRKIKRLSE